MKICCPSGMFTIVSKYIVSFSKIFWLNLLYNHKLFANCAIIPLGVCSRFPQVQPSLKSILGQRMICVLKSPYFHFWNFLPIKKLERKLVLTKGVSRIETKARMINHIHKWNHSQVQIFRIWRNQPWWLLET